MHSGRRREDALPDVFFKQLDLPAPDVDLGVASGTYIHQTAGMMLGLEREFQRERPDAVLVFGDINATLAAALSASQLGIRVGHVEAGLRSGDRVSVGEMNRVLVDQVSTWLFAPHRDAEANLRAEGIPAEKIHFVGNTLIDTLVKYRPAAARLRLAASMGIADRRYVLVTVHKAANIDSEPHLQSIMYALLTLADHTDVVFPAQQRTTQRLKDFGLYEELAGHARLRLLSPLAYLEFLSLLNDAGAVLTDSGGVQEEAVVIGVPCVTLRTTTEHPVTLRDGANRLAGGDPHLAIRYISEALANGHAPAAIPEGWDGRAAGRIVDVLATDLDGQQLQRRVAQQLRA